MNMVKSMRKAVVLRSVFAFFGLSMTAANADAVNAGATWSMDIVDELDALSQQDEKTNPWAASQGGTWGFYEGTASALGEAWTYVKTDKGLVGFYDDSRRYCCFLANPSTSQKAGPSAVNAKIDGRKVLYHPKSESSVETLRYVPASAGAYSVSGTVRKLSSSGNGVTADVVVNGVTLASVTSATDVVTFAVTNGAVWAGQTIDLRLTGNGNYVNDATELTYLITRIGDAQAPIVQTASEILAAAIRTEPAMNPTVQPGGRPGTWGFYRRTSSGDALLTARLYDKGACGLAVSASTGSFPQILVNTNKSALTPTNATKPIDPGEIFLHPEDKNNPVVLRHTADVAGRYSFAVTGRDRGVGNGNGVNLVVWHVPSDGGTGVVLARTLCAPSQTVSLSGADVFLGVGESIELAVDANGANPYDATGLRFSVCLDEKVPGVVSFGAVSAMRANRASSSPAAVGYVDAQGGKWSYGSSDEATFAFTPCTAEKTVGTFSGWSAATYLLLLVNANNVEANCSGHGTVAGDELAVHPDSKKAATVRFSAPLDGLYAVSGRVRALNANSGGNGVEGRVAVRESGFATRGLASAKTDDELPTQIDLSVSGLWLKANDSVDLSLGPNGSINFDASAMSWMVTRTGDLPTLPYVSFDICGTVRDSVSGAGRIGLATDGAWVPVRAGSMKSSLGPVVGGMRRAVQLVLSKPASSAALANVATVVSDGVVSAGADDPVAFSVTGLEPNQTYSFCAYSRNASGVCGVFEIGGEARTADETWFCHVGGDCCRFMATADANGVIMGTFRGTSDGAATFCALQVTGETFPEFKPNGGILIFR